MRTIFYSLFYLLCLQVSAFDTLRINPSFERVDLLKRVAVIKTDRTVNIQAIAARVQEQPNAFTELTRANLGYTDKIVWVVIPFVNSYDDDKILLELQNPHLDYIDAYLLIGDSLATLGNPTGDNRAFNTRAIPYRHFLWPIPKSQRKTHIIFRIEKLNSSLVVPLIAWHESAFLKHETQLLITYGLFFGIMLAVLLYSVGLGLILKQNIHFYYVGLIGMSLAYFVIDEGFGYQFLYRQWTGINSLMRVVILGINTIALILFSIQFLNIKHYKSSIATMLYGIITLLVIMIILTPVLSDFYLAHSSFFVPFALAVTFTGNLLPLLVAVLTRKEQRTNALFFLVAYSIVLITGTLVRLEDIGWIERLPFNPVYIGAFLENMIFFIALSYRTKKVYDQRNELALKINRHQKEMIQSYVRGTEQERQRVARDLHDDIGSRISHVKRQMESLNQHELLPEVDKLCNDIRNLSHQLAPQAIQFNSLAQLIEQQSYLLHQAGIKATLQQYDFPETIPTNIKTELVRIVQEGIQNIIKHAEAKQVDIQLFKHDNQLIITLEDDGNGFDVNRQHAGIGLTNMKARAESLDGMLEISSRPDHGTSIIISIPVPAY
jgi:signal transduction histidine kinase